MDAIVALLDESGLAIPRHMKESYDQQVSRLRAHCIALPAHKRPLKRGGPRLDVTGNEGLRITGAGFRIQESGFRIQNSGFRIQITATNAGSFQL